MMLSKMRIGLRVKYPLSLSDFNENRIFFDGFLKILVYQMSGKSVQWYLSFSMQMDGWTDGQT